MSSMDAKCASSCVLGAKNRVDVTTHRTTFRGRGTRRVDSSGTYMAHQLSEAGPDTEQPMSSVWIRLAVGLQRRGGVQLGAPLCHDDE